MPETPVFLINIDNPYLPSSYFKAPYEGSFLKDLRTGKYLKFRCRKVSPAVKKDYRIGTGRFYEATFIFRLFFDEYSIADPSVVIRIYLTSKMLQFYRVIFGNFHPTFSNVNYSICINYCKWYGHCTIPKGHLINTLDKFYQKVLH